MCGVDFQYEMDEESSHFVNVYPSIAVLKKNKTCWFQCGIVKVKVEEAKWVEKQDFNRKKE